MALKLNASLGIALLTGAVLASVVLPAHAFFGRHNQEQQPVQYGASMQCAKKWGVFHNSQCPQMVMMPGSGFLSEQTPAQAQSDQPGVRQALSNWFKNKLADSHHTTVVPN